jgi:hypothetical protein
MKKYKVYLNQYVTAQVRVELEVESDKSLEELEEDIYEQIEDWSRLARFHPENESFPGEYVKGSYSYELDYQGDDGDEIDVYVEESDNE